MTKIKRGFFPGSFFVGQFLIVRDRRGYRVIFPDGDTLVRNSTILKCARACRKFAWAVRHHQPR